MKLRNKKTGEIGEPRVAYQEIYVDTTEHKSYCYKSIAGLYEDWEDVGGTNDTNTPLINDEKIRKAVRAWLEANDLDGATYYTSSHHWYLRAFNDREQGIDFWLNWENKPNLIENKYYTIEELCGEEDDG